MKKTEIISRLKESHDSLWETALSKKLSNNEFKANGKWSVEENVEHINKSIAAAAKYFNAPKNKLGEKFGFSGGESRNMENFKSAFSYYLSNGAKSTAPYLPDLNAKIDLNELITQGKLILGEMIVAVNKWQEDELDNYLCPHPLMGNITAREMCYFTSLHALHHQKAIEAIN